ncbi:hypothetical protein BJX64DRAFT_294954 [Aspergillus heterothallicus]
MLGPMPEPWWSSGWKERKEFFRDEADENGRAVADPLRKFPPPSTMGEIMKGNIFHRFLGSRRRLWLDVEIPEKEKPVFEDLLRSMLKWNPDGRPSAEEVLQHPWFAFEDEDDDVEYPESGARAEMHKYDSAEDE